MHSRSRTLFCYVELSGRLALCASWQPATPDMHSPETVRNPPKSPPILGLLVLGMMVGTVNGLNRVAMPLFAASLGAQRWQVGIVGGLGYFGILLLALPMGAW